MEIQSPRVKTLPTLAIGLFFTFMALAGLAQSHRIAIDTHKIDSLIQTTSLRPFNGMILVAHHGKALYSKAYGAADMVKKTGFAPDAQFVIGSVSKQITAVLVLQASEKGLIDLQSPVKKYLPKLTMPWADTITAHHLLCHASGIQGREMPLAFKPGARFSYSNQGYGLLGEILAAVHGKPYDDLVMALFKRCGMRHSGTPTSIKLDKLLTGFSKQPDGSIAAESNTLQGIPVPAGLLISTAADLVRWNVMLHQKQKLLSAKTYAEMLKTHSRRPHPIFGDVDYGYGLQFTRLDSIHEISHGGYAPGFVTVNFYYPKTGTSLIVMENLDWQDPAFKESYHFEMEIRRIVRRAQL
jgi:D-alanyl-D-alanine carboxypeptidase